MNGMVTLPADVVKAAAAWKLAWDEQRNLGAEWRAREAAGGPKPTDEDLRRYDALEREMSRRSVSPMLFILSDLMESTA